MKGRISATRSDNWKHKRFFFIVAVRSQEEILNQFIVSTCKLVYEYNYMHNEQTWILSCWLSAKKFWYMAIAMNVSGKIFLLLWEIQNICTSDFVRNPCRFSDIKVICKSIFYTRIRLNSQSSSNQVIEISISAHSALIRVEKGSDSTNQNDSYRYYDTHEKSVLFRQLFHFKFNLLLKTI